MMETKTELCLLSGAPVKDDESSSTIRQLRATPGEAGERNSNVNKTLIS